MPERRALHAYLSADAHDGWTQLTIDNGISVTALVEAIGLALPKSPLDLDVLVMEARKIDVRRRRRNGVHAS